MAKHLKHIPYGRQSIADDDISRVVKTLKSDWITQGPGVKAFEDALCVYTGAKYAVAAANGTAALHVACLAAGIRQGDEAITSPVTFAASANSVVYCGGKPVFADIQGDTVNIDPQQIVSKITKRTRALIPVHFAGHPCDMTEIRAIARKHKLIVIEDAAHALGSEYKGRKIGSCQYSDMTIFSFHPVKSITTGEGGAVMTNNKKIYESLLLLRNHGITKDAARFVGKPHGPWYHEMQELGFNYRITDFQCALGLGQLGKLDGFIKKRKAIVEIYRQKLSALKEIDLPVEKDHVASAWHIFYIRLKDASRRRKVFEHLRARGIGVQVHYMPVYFHPFYQKTGYKMGACPAAEDYYSRTISLPLFPSMNKKEIQTVISCVCEAVSR